MEDELLNAEFTDGRERKPNRKKRDYNYNNHVQVRYQ